MQKRGWITLIVIAVVLILAVGVVWGVTHYVFAGGHLYAKSAEVLDLRGMEITQEDFEKIANKMPDCDITWDVPFQGGTVSSKEAEITVTGLSDADVLALDYLTELETVHGENCPDYAQLAQLQQRHPESKVLYKMTVSGKSCDQDTSKLTLKGLTAEDAALLSYLPQLEKVEVSGCSDYAMLQQLQQEHPQWNLTYTVTLGGEEFDWDAASVEASDASYGEITEGLPGLVELKSLSLTNPDADADQLLGLRQEYPDIDITWQVEIYGQTVAEDVTELDISGAEVESCEEVERLVACLPNLEKLIMTDCGIDSETMAEFRERQRDNYKVVWTVYLGDKCKVRTDETYFMPIKQGEYYFKDEYSEELKYCEDMVCIDVGHHKIHNIDFVAYMPHLKYLILAHTEVQDVSPIVNCQELVYLEVDWSTIRDYSPIAQVKSLEDLNLNQTYCKIDPILEMTWLKNLWAPGRSYAIQQQLIEALPDTHLQLADKNPAGQGWRNLPNYYAMRDYLGMYYME